MKNLFEILNEGILDIDDLEAQVDKTMADTWAKENLRGNYTLRKLKNGKFKIYGNAILRKYNGTDFGGIVIDSLDGSLYVEDCPNLQSLDGLFAKTNWGDVITKVAGDIKITNCKSFNSLKGLPDFIDGEFVCVDCPSLKSLDDAPDLVTDVTIIKAGKKFSEKQIKTHFKCAMKIMCSQEEYENMIIEALSEPHLLEFWDWVKKTYPKLQKELDDLVADRGLYYGDRKIQKITLSGISDSIRLDQVRPSDVTVYDNYKDKVKDIRKALLKVANSDSVVIIKNLDRDKDSQYEFIGAGHGAGVRGADLTNWQRVNLYSGRPYKSFGKMEFCDMAGTASGKPNGHREFIIIDINDIQGNRWKMKSDRRKSREGMIENTPEFYEQVARANRKRWKEIIAQAKAMNVTNEFITVAQKMEPLIMRFARVPQKLKDYNWTSNYNAESAVEQISKKIESATSASMRMMRYVYVAQGKRKDWLSKPDALKKAQDLKQNLLEYIANIDKRLTTIGL